MGKDAPTNDELPEAESKTTEEAPFGAPISFSAFLADVPPYSVRLIEKATKATRRSYARRVFALPTVTFHCDSAGCSGDRIFEPTDEWSVDDECRVQHEFIRYICRNCRTRERVFAVMIQAHEDDQSKIGIMKLGEWPTYGKPLPQRLSKLIGEDRGLFLLGYRSETQSMGIGAFAYYRRVLENQYKRLVRQLISACEKLEAPKEVLDDLNAALSETQFSRAVDKIRHALPPALQISGQNPLRLLYSELSNGVHQYSDDECLELAHHIRVVLFELAERLDSALASRVELAQAVSRLLKKRPWPPPLSHRPSGSSSASPRRTNRRG